jgi:adenylate kinase
MNPDLVDKRSAAGQQSVRGRQGRIDFANSFETIYQFKSIYVSGTSYFPILGATIKLSPSEPWVAHQRRDLADGKGEVNIPILSSEMIPSGEDNCLSLSTL